MVEDLLICINVIADFVFYWKNLISIIDKFKFFIKNIQNKLPKIYQLAFKLFFSSIKLKSIIQKKYIYINFFINNIHP